MLLKKERDVQLTRRVTLISRETKERMLRELTELRAELAEKKREQAKALLAAEKYKVAELHAYLHSKAILKPSPVQNTLHIGHHCTGVSTLMSWHPGNLADTVDSVIYNAATAAIEELPQGIAMEDPYM